MFPSTEESPKVIPAHVGLLAIYNPSLGTNDETIQDQIVYYYSQEEQRRSRDHNQDASREQRNEQLRQIGLAQGIVEFSRNFSDGSPVDTVDTEKSRMILHELESGWWILASINLTVLPKSSKVPTEQRIGEDQATVEYSSREVKPAALLLEDLLQGHSTFLLHHASSMSALFVRSLRTKFIGLLTRYWDTYLSNWNVLMHGNPANNLYSGIKVAASGELGMGVGEEERGSGEREVLEGFVRRINGLVDIMVSKFGDQSTGQDQTTAPSPQRPWLGSGNDPEADDGAIFLGTGALSRKSIRDISHWIQDLYRWGPHAYGVVDNPASNRRTKKATKRDQHKHRELSPEARENAREVYGLPYRQPSEGKETLASVEPMSVPEDHANDQAKSKYHHPSVHQGPSSHNSTDSESTRSQKFVNYLKLGYGTHWTLGSTPTEEESEGNAADKAQANTNMLKMKESRASTHRNSDGPDTSLDDSIGHYLIGLMGGLDEDPYATRAAESQDTEDEMTMPDDNSRVLIRTLTVELERAEDARAEADISIDLGEMRSDNASSKNSASERAGTSIASFESQDRNKTKKLRVVVYAHKPFIFVFLFELRTDALDFAQHYRSLHTQLAPLRKPLLHSTRFRAPLPDLPSASNTSATTNRIYHLLWDPITLTVNSTIPNIPSPFQPASTQTIQPWTRVEALSTHLHILSTYNSNEIGDHTTLERTGKTSRGWWVVWLRIPRPVPSPTTDILSASNRSTGRVKVPTLITEDSAESRFSVHGSPSASPNSRPMSSSGEEGKKPPTATLSAKRYRSSKGVPSTFTNASAYSGLAHPFQEAATSTGARRSRDKEVWLVRRGGKEAVGRLRSLVGGEGEKEEVGRGIGLGDYKGFVEGLLGLR